MNFKIEITQNLLDFTFMNKYLKFDINYLLLLSHMSLETLSIESIFKIRCETSVRSEKLHIGGLDMKMTILYKFNHKVIFI